MNTFFMVIHFAYTEIRSVLRQPRMMAFLLLLPLIFSSVLSLFQSSETGSTQMLMTRPNTPLALAFEQRLRDRGLFIEQADPRRAPYLLARTERDLWLQLPKDFDAQWQNAENIAGKKVPVKVVAAPSNLRVHEALLSIEVAASQLLVPTAAKKALLSQMPNASQELQRDAEKRSLAWLKRSVIEISVEDAAVRASSSKGAAGASQTTPGMTLMFALLFGAQTGLALQRERTFGTLARLYSAPISMLTVVFGKIIGNAIILMAQLGIMIVFSSLVLGVHWGNVAVLSVPALAFSLAASAFGSLCASLTRTPAHLTSVSIVAVNLSSALGGLWWPLDVTPLWMQNFARILPTYWGITALQNVMLRGADLQAVLPHTLILLGFAALFLLIGMRAFRFE